MNEELDSQLSAMFDDELPESECELLARRLSRDGALQARWGRYAAIGAAVRGGDVRLGGRVAQRVSVVLAGELEVSQAPPAVLRAGTPALARWWRPLAGVAVAASVAAVSIVWLQGNLTPATAGLVARNAVPVAPAVETPATYVVPRAAEPRAMMPAMELANYVVAHSEFSPPVSRRNLLSALMANEAQAAAAPEQSSGAVDDPNRHADDAH
jgi:sigma-E factor negative regulatory protein RseA